jgi:speckle-type POZ protein
MLGSGFLEFKLDYAQIHNIGIGDVVSSENFSAGGYLWRINCYPRGDEIYVDGEHLSICLQLVTKSKNVKAIFDASLVGRDGMLSSSDVLRSVEVYTPNNDPEKGWDRFVKLSDLESSYVINGTVTVLCGVMVVPDIDNTLPVPPQPDLASHLGHLLDSALGTDVSFVVGGEVFPAHRAVLAARSPVFSAELFGPMADATMPSITLHDIEPAAFRVMLQFMYTDALPADDELGDPLVEMMIHLLAAADRYALDRLKVICELKLCENVSAETVASVLACAETYGCLKLKTKCMDLFALKRNFKKAVVTDGFIMLLQKFPTLAGELARRVAL